jgi:hypothetical protein
LHSIYTSKKWKLAMALVVPVLLTKALISKTKLLTKRVFHQLR